MNTLRENFCVCVGGINGLAFLISMPIALPELVSYGNFFEPVVLLCVMALANFFAIAIAVYSPRARH